MVLVVFESIFIKMCIFDSKEIFFQVCKGCNIQKQSKNFEIRRGDGSKSMLFCKFGIVGMLI